MLAITVLPEAACIDVERRVAGRDQIKRAGADDGAEALRDRIPDEFIEIHAPGDIGAEAHRWIHVAAGHRSDSVSHGDDGEPERERNAQLPNLLAGQHRRPAPEQDERESADEFRGEFLGHVRLQADPIQPHRLARVRGGPQMRWRALSVRP